MFCTTHPPKEGSLTMWKESLSAEKICIVRGNALSVAEHLIFQTVIITDTHSVLKSLKEIRKRSDIVLQFRSTEQMQIIEAENIFCFPRNCKATMVMFAGQKYRQFHGYPMDDCSIRKSALYWKCWYQTWRSLLQIRSFFAQEYSTWVSDRHRQDTPVTFDIFASRGTDLCSSGSFLKAICRAKKSPHKLKIRQMALQTVLILRWSRNLEFSACIKIWFWGQYWL